ncbi:thyrotropin-releasing hormone receptor-like isoform X2 [Lineus longissimus]|uniref:thyrotropin-releasing hormone receptor-like isoform X2 n=1 Tax=Lineus longissimus TaxID=88925 RepID=UPI00315DE59B
MEVIDGYQDPSQNWEGSDFVLDLNISRIAMYDDIIIPFNITEPLYWSHSYKAVGFSFGLLVFLIGFIGNIGVIATLWKSPSLFVQNGASATYRFIFCLAVADLSVLLTSALPHLIELFLILNQWVYGRAGCSVLVFMQYLSEDVGGLALLCIAFERYRSITKPDASTFTIKRTNITILSIWLVVITFCSPWLVLTKTVAETYFGSDGHHVLVEECTFKLSAESFAGYYVTDTILFYLVPVVASATMYTMIGLKVTQGRVAIDRQKEDYRKQVFVMLTMATLLFGLLMMPYRCLILYNLLMPSKFYNMWFFLFARQAVYTSSALKPLVYIACSYQFRKAFKNVVCCRNRQEDNLHLELQATAHATML